MLSLNCFWFILSWKLGIFFYCVLLFRYITALLFYLIPLSFIHALFCSSLSTQLFLSTSFICLSHISKISCNLEFLPPMFWKHFLSYFIIALRWRWWSSFQCPHQGCQISNNCCLNVFLGLLKFKFSSFFAFVDLNDLMSEVHHHKIMVTTRIYSKQRASLWSVYV